MPQSLRLDVNARPQSLSRLEAGAWKLENEARDEVHSCGARLLSEMRGSSILGRETARQRLWEGTTLYEYASHEGNCALPHSFCRAQTLKLKAQ
jgi:hypothetical protein